MTEPAPSPTLEVAALRELTQAFYQHAIALSIIAREGAKAEELAENAENAARQAVVIAQEVRGIAREIRTNLDAHQRAFEEFFTKALAEFGGLARRIEQLEATQSNGANGHG